MKMPSIGQLSWPAKAAALLGAVGFAWAMLLVFPAAYSAVFKPSAEDQQPYEAPGGSSYGNDRKIFDRLSGVSPNAAENHKKPCWYGSAIWSDREPLVRGRGPSNGSNVTYWLAETIDNEVFVGRYSFNLSYLVEPGTGAIGFSHTAQDADNTRLIERIPPPPPGPPGWRMILPGQCVLAKEQPPDADGAIGRFLIDLPARVRVQIDRVTSSKKSGMLVERLSFNGKEAAREAIPGAEEGPGYREFNYRTDQAGLYALTVHHSPYYQKDGPEGKERLRYSLMVAWGENGFTRSCSSPRYDLSDLSCLGGTDND